MSLLLSRREFSNAHCSRSNIHLRLSSSCLCPRTQAHTHPRTHTRTHSLAHTHTRTDARARTHTHTRTRQAILTMGAHVSLFPGGEMGCVSQEQGALFSSAVGTERPTGGTRELSDNQLRDAHETAEVIKVCTFFLLSCISFDLSLSLCLSTYVCAGASVCLYLSGVCMFSLFHQLWAQTDPQGVHATSRTTSLGTHTRQRKSSRCVSGCSRTSMD